MHETTSGRVREGVRKRGIDMNGHITVLIIVSRKTTILAMLYLHTPIVELQTIEQPAAVFA